MTKDWMQRLQELPSGQKCPSDLKLGCQEAGHGLAMRMSLVTDQIPIISSLAP